MAEYTTQLEKRTANVTTAFREAHTLLASVLGDAGSALLGDGGGVKRVLDALSHAACSELTDLSDAHQQLARNGLKAQALTNEISLRQQRTASKVAAPCLPHTSLPARASAYSTACLCIFDCLHTSPHTRERMRCMCLQVLLLNKEKELEASFQLRIEEAVVTPQGLDPWSTTVRALTVDHVRVPAAKAPAAGGR